MKKTLLTLLVGATVANAAAQMPLTSIQFDAHTSKAKVSTLHHCVLENHESPQSLQSTNAKRLSQRFHQAAQTRMKREANGKIQLPPQLQRTTSYSSAQSTSGVLNESFEGWDGETPDWLPDGWTEQTSDASLAQLEKGRFTWHTCNPRSVAPTEGAYSAVIYYAQVPDPNDSTGKKKLDLPQDEWLISPVFTPQEGENLLFDLAYSPLFLFNLNNEYVDFDSFEFIEQKPSTTLQIMARLEGGEWEMLHDIYNEWKDYSLSELYSKYMETVFRSYDLPLERFTGKPMQVAFRFVGQYGNTMYLDAVKCGKQALPTAYEWPAGSFYWAYNDQLETLHDAQGKSFMLVPPYTDITWTNSSSTEATSFTWQYADPASPWSYLTTETKNLTVNYPYNAYAIPVLTSHAEGYGDGSYTWDGISFQAGGTGIYTGENGQLVSYGMSRFDPRVGLQIMTDVNGGPFFGHHSKSRITWTNFFNLTGEDWGELQGVGNKFAAPATPYLVSKVRMHGTGEVEADAVLTAHIFSVTPEGTLGEELGRGTCKGKDVIQMENNMLTFAFPIQRVSADGQLLEEPVIVDKEVLVMVDGMAGNDRLTSMGVLNTNQTNKTLKTDGYVFVLFMLDGQEKLNAYPTSAFNSGDRQFNIDFAITVDATYNWLTVEEKEIEIGAEGGTYNLPVNYYLTSWTVDVKNADNTETKWLSYQLSDDRKSLQLTAEPMGKDEKRRSCTITLRGWGVEDSLVVKQGNGTSITNRPEEQKEKAWINGDILCVQSEKAHNATLHEASGRQIMQWNLQDGQSVTNLKALAKGMYIIRLDNGITHKIMR